jgi:hypothetical protein
MCAAASHKPDTTYSSTAELFIFTSPTKFGVSEYDREASLMRTTWPNRGYAPW